jgi:alpha-beta hydrolase superfamily lysophospholipase
MSKVKKYINVKSIPLLLLYGDNDPCVGGEKGSNHSINTLKKAGFNNIKKIKYERMRHEILNEDNKDAVISDIINFLK